MGNNQLVNSQSFLECEFLSSKWKAVLREAAPYSPQEHRVLSLVLPVPEKNETLLFYRDNATGYHASNQTLTTLQKHGTMNDFLVYSSLTRALKKVGLFGQKLFPMVNLTTCLFPFGYSAQHAVWINPAEIVEIKERESFTYVQLRNGRNVQTMVGKRTLVAHAEDALGLLATLRKDRLHTELPGEKPLDFLTLADTPFLSAIAQKPKLQKFLLPTGVLTQLYDNERFIQTILTMEQKISTDVLAYPSLSNLLNQKN